MSFLIERRLRAVGRRLASLREELTITDEQLEHLADLTDDSRIRAMVSETPLADEEHRDAGRPGRSPGGERVGERPSVGENHSPDLIPERVLDDSSGRLVPVLPCVPPDHRGERPRT